MEIGQNDIKLFQTKLFNKKCSSNLFVDKKWQISKLIESNLQDVIQISTESFPLEYPDYWYKEVVTGKFISFGLFYEETLTSLLVAEIKTAADCDIEDRTLCSENDWSPVVYILSLAVRKEYRRCGIATQLLTHLFKLIDKLAFIPKLIFLHVLAENHAAINFYKQNGFFHYTTLKNYYQIDNVYYNGYTMVCYFNQKKNEIGATKQSNWSLKQFYRFLKAIISTPIQFVLRIKLPFCRL